MEQLVAEQPEQEEDDPEEDSAPSRLEPPPIRKALKSFFTFFPSQPGHSIAVEAEKTSFSNTSPHRSHSYSKIGMTNRI